jgi:SAM-dependent methyltransferase
MSERADWRAANKANWDERVGVHMGERGYDLRTLRAGRGALNPIEEAELGPVAGMRILHLQCHFGADSLKLAQRGAAEVVGLDFSPAAIIAARKLANEVGLADRVSFVEADLYDAIQAIDGPHGFDLVYVTWGTIVWLPDVARWARIVAHFLRPGGTLYLADGHPAALVLDDAQQQSDGMPGFSAPYFAREPMVIDDASDYADPQAQLQNARTYQWIHPLGAVVSELVAAGLRLSWLHEHDSVPWRMFNCLVRQAPGRYCWPNKAWLPLSFSLKAVASTE